MCRRGGAPTGAPGDRAAQERAGAPAGPPGNGGAGEAGPKGASDSAANQVGHSATSRVPRCGDLAVAG
eukprot:336081-Alexandrium_andersonii.AAC.1